MLNRHHNANPMQTAPHNAQCQKESPTDRPSEMKHENHKINIKGIRRGRCRTHTASPHPITAQPFTPQSGSCTPMSLASSKVTQAGCRPLTRAGSVRILHGRAPVKGGGRKEAARPVCGKTLTLTYTGRAQRTRPRGGYSPEKG